MRLYADLKFIFQYYVNMTSQNNTEYSIGIDLGTTYCCISVVKNNKVEIICDELGNKIIPSFISFKEDEILIGELAKNELIKNPTNTVFDIKRLLGKSFTDPIIQRDLLHFPFKVVPDNDNKIMVKIEQNNSHKLFYPEVLSSMILKKLKSIAESYLGTEVKNAVITVPAYFTDNQRQLTKYAGSLAGLNILRIINEPTSACISYGLDKSLDDKNILVFDLGGGTLDVSILNVASGVFTVKSTSGDTHLGGENFDNIIAEFCFSEFAKKYKLNTSQVKELLINSKIKGKLKRECEYAKKIVSSTNQTNIIIDNFFMEKDLNVQLTKSKFDALCDTEFKKCFSIINKAIDDAKLTISEIDDIVLVGGSTRIPKIRQLLKDFFNKEPKVDINPDEAVAYGAGIQASILSNNQSSFDLVLVDVTPLTLGIEGKNGIMIPIINRNTPVPYSKELYFSTVSDNQPSVTIKVYEGERDLVKDNILLGQFELVGIPPAKRAEPKIKVKFTIDVNGILQVTAIEETSGKSSSLTITNTNKIKKEDIQKMLENAEKCSISDKEIRKLIELKEQFYALLFDLRSKFSDISYSHNDEHTIKQNKITHYIQFLDKNNYSYNELYSNYTQAIQLLQK